MAHELENMMYVGQTPWHGLGKKVDQAPSIEEAIILAGLDWKVKVEQLQTKEGEKVESYITRRESDKRILGVVGSRYHPLQNKEAFNFFKPFVEQGCTIDTAGSLKSGQKVWMLAKIGSDPLKITKEDVVEKYLLLSNSHDGTTSVRVGFTPIRVVCNNTLSMAHGSDKSQLIRIHHTKSVQANLEAIQETINIANQRFETTAEKYRALLKKQVNKKDIEKFVHQVFFPQVVDFKADDLSARQLNAYNEMNNTITRLFERGRGNDMQSVKGTYWALYNGVTEYLSYEANKDQDSRLTSLWFGQNEKVNERALDLALVMAG
jgi:phage/plasmid-like protein (TIGR03299 family)